MFNMKASRFKSSFCDCFIQVHGILYGFCRKFGNLSSSTHCLLNLRVFFMLNVESVAEFAVSLVPVFNLGMLTQVLLN